MAAKKKVSTEKADSGDVIADLIRSVATDPKGVVSTLGGGSHYDPDAVISSGSIVLDYGIGRGGYLKGLLVHAYGREASGKTTLALNAIRQIQQTDPEANIIYSDTENSMNDDLMRALKIDYGRVKLVNPEHQEEFVKITNTLLKGIKEGGEDFPSIPLFVLDSVAETQSKEVVEAEADVDTSRAKEARVWTKSLPGIGKLTRETQTVQFFINQAREVQNAPSYLPPMDRYPSGRAMKHKAGINMEVKFKSAAGYSEFDKESRKKLLHAMEVTLTKNKSSGRSGTRLIVRFVPGQLIHRGWGLVDVWPHIVADETMRKRSFKGEPEDFASAYDYIPYGPGKMEKGVHKESAGYWYLEMTEDVLAAIREDQPDFKPNAGEFHNLAHNSKTNLLAPKSFVSFIEDHPALADLLEESILLTLNLDETYEEVEGEYREDLYEDSEGDYEGSEEEDEEDEDLEDAEEDEGESQDWDEDEVSMAGVTDD